MKKLEIIETPEYYLLISDEEIKKGEELIPNKWYINSYRGYDRPFKNHNLDNNGYLKQVIAYQPKNNASELNLPLLPEIVIEDDYIQSLKQPKTPKWFVAEMETGEVWNGLDTQKFSRLKTTTINGKTFLVGTYLYE